VLVEPLDSRLKRAGMTRMNSRLERRAENALKRVSTRFPYQPSNSFDGTDAHADAGLEQERVKHPA
jgi:hypothetical protein